MEKWVVTKQFGDIYIEEILAILNIPFVFVSYFDNKRYLTLCYNDRDGKYILSQCDNTSLIKILNGKLSIDTFLKDTNDIILLDLVDWDKAVAHKNKYKDLSKDILPKKDTFFTIKNKSIDEYVKKLYNEISIKVIKPDFSLTNKSINEYMEKLNKISTKAIDVYEYLYANFLIVEVKKEFSIDIIFTKKSNRIKKCQNRIIELLQDYEVGSVIKNNKIKKGVTNEQPSKINKIVSAS